MESPARGRRPRAEESLPVRGPAGKRRRVEVRLSSPPVSRRMQAASSRTAPMKNPQDLWTAAIAIPALLVVLVFVFARRRGRVNGRKFFPTGKPEVDRERLRQWWALDASLSYGYDVPRGLAGQVVHKPASFRLVPSGSGAVAVIDTLVHAAAANVDFTFGLARALAAVRALTPRAAA